MWAFLRWRFPWRVSYEIGEAFAMYYFFFSVAVTTDLVWRDEGKEREWIPIKLFNL